MLIQEFHSKLDPQNDHSTLFDALRRLRLVKDLKSVALEDARWIVWTDSAPDPDNPDGGSFRLATA